MEKYRLKSNAKEELIKKRKIVKKEKR